MSGAADFFKKLQSQIPQLEREIAQTVILVEAEKLHAENFKKEGFTDKTFQKWQPRKKPDKKGEKRALLVKTSALKRNATKGQVVGNHVDFVFPLEYMKVHNEGLQAGRGKGFKMPKRQFVGESAELEKRIEAKAKKLIDDKLKNL